MNLGSTADDFIAGTLLATTLNAAVVAAERCGRDAWHNCATCCGGGCCAAETKHSAL